MSTTDLSSTVDTASELSFGQRLIRRKIITVDALSEGKLKRCLTTFDLTALGVGSSLGLGVYVLAGQVAATKAGPAVMLSFFFAAVASVFAGLCYAEFGARVPKAGSAYVYSYTTVGEFIAFLIGWNLILEYVIGTASIARGFSGYVDNLLGETISSQLLTWFPLRTEGLSPYLDIFAFFITMAVCVMLAFGVKESANFNTVLTAINLYVVAYVIICGCFKINWGNWDLPKNPARPETGNGGFFPFGYSGMMAGAATCFYGFIGFDAIASTGEEAKNPQKSMPISIILSLSFILVAFFGVAGVSTLMWPYYDQNVPAPLSFIFDKVGWPVAKYITAVGAISSLSTALLGTLFPLPRVLYAMANDGLVFEAFGQISARSQTPVFATAFSGCFAGLMASLFDVQQLADMMSIGTMLAYTLVTISVLILRYQEDHLQVGGSMAEEIASSSSMGSEDTFSKSSDGVTFAKLINRKKMFKSPNYFTARFSLVLIGLICITVIIMNSTMVVFEKELFSGDILVCSVVAVALLCVFIEGILLALQPQTKLRLPFKVPWLPTVPILSVFCNFYLMLKLPRQTWIRFGVWLIAGFTMYFFYGMRNSVGALTEAEKEKRIKDRRSRKLQLLGSNLPSYQSINEPASVN